MNSVQWGGWNYLSNVVTMTLFVAVCLCVKFVKFKSAINVLVSKKFKSLLLKNGSYLRYAAKHLLFLTGFIFLMIALLQPQWDKKEEVVEQEGRDLLIAVDISRSMLAQDLQPNRLEFAKHKIKKLLYNLSCERVGLLLFSGSTVVQCPLTTDYSAFFMFLDQIDVETISSGTTSIDQAVRQAMSTFDMMNDKKTKLLCLFTDGEDFSTNLSGIKDKAAKQGLSIFTFGIGSEHGAPVPIVDEQGKQTGFEKNRDGSVVMSKLNEGILKNLSQETGGKYIHATDSDKDIHSFINCVQRFEKDKIEDKKLDRWQEQYHYFVAAGFICFILEWLL